MNENLNAARMARNDEFYTQLADIENELRHYRHHFRDKVVYCNCDDPRISNFFHYFSYNFEFLGLKKLITTCYKNQNPDMFTRLDSERAIKLEYDGFRDGDRVPRPEDIGIDLLEGDGDFRSDECIELLKQVDIVVTNPPFSLFREYVMQLVEYGKKFLIIGNKNAVTYNEVFPLIRENKLWIGVTPMGRDMLFDIPPDQSEEVLANRQEGSTYRMVDGVVKRRGAATWFTNLNHARRREEALLFKRYTPQDYPAYDNYDAIEVAKVAEIPKDYDGVMAVPITFLDKYNPEQFDILSANDFKTNPSIPDKPHGLIKDKDGTVAGHTKPRYVRILIKRKLTYENYPT